MAICSNCGGSGEVYQDGYPVTCGKCGGAGEINGFVTAVENTVGSVIGGIGHFAAEFLVNVWMETGPQDD